MLTLIPYGKETKTQCRLSGTADGRNLTRRSMSALLALGGNYEEFPGYFLICIFIYTLVYFLFFFHVMLLLSPFLSFG